MAVDCSMVGKNILPPQTFSYSTVQLVVQVLLQRVDVLRALPVFFDALNSPLAPPCQKTWRTFQLPLSVNMTYIAESSKLQSEKLTLNRSK